MLWVSMVLAIAHIAMTIVAEQSPLRAIPLEHWYSQILTSNGGPNLTSENFLSTKTFLTDIYLLDTNKTPLD